jgi:hypothetical protein
MIPCALTGCGRSAGPDPTAPAPSLDSPIMAAEKRSLPPISPGAPTYPIPPELLTQVASRREVGVAAMPPPGMERSRAGGKAKPGPTIEPIHDEAELRRVAGPRVDRRVGSARRAPSSFAANRAASSTGGMPGSSPVVVQHNVTETAPSASQAVSENKARVPLVDDQPRVHILE